MVTLGELVLERRRQKQMTQEELAAQVLSSKQWLSRIERGTKAPSLDLALKLYDVLAADPAEESQLMLWMLKWLEAHGKHEAKLGERQMAAIHSLVTNTLQLVNRAPGSQPNRKPRTLMDFPHAFYPLTIVCGDRREPSPLTLGDLFAYSVAITDLTFLARLGLDQSVQIRSDKLFVLMEEDDLRSEFGQTNLLIIGSPAVNFAARRINKHSVFQFNLAPEMAAWEHYVTSRKVPDDQDYLKLFWDMAQAQKPIDYAAFRDRKIGDKPIAEQTLKELVDLINQLLGRGGPKELMNAFRKPGIVDPADDMVHAQATRIDNDFAVISLARNPFAASNNTDYVCIMVGGIHGPGTAHAIRALAQANTNFEDHPLGGVLEVKLNPYKNWPNRFERASYAWQTKSYTPADLIATFKHALAKPTDHPHLSEATLKDCLAFVESLVGDILS